MFCWLHLFRSTLFVLLPVARAGRVVGIIRRNWRARGYAASLKPPAPGQKAPKSGVTANVLVLPVDRRYPAIR
jgi:exosome complex exonuclease DIS3/RRP44